MEKSPGKRFSYALLLAFGLSIILCGCGKDNREIVSSPEGKFTILLPTGYPPAEKIDQNIPRDSYNAVMTTYLSGNLEGACMVNFCDHPKEIIEKLGSENILNNERDNAMKNTSGRLENEEAYSVDGNPGKKIYFTGKYQEKEVYGQAVFIVRKNRIYQIVYMNLSKDALAKPEIQSFFSSFKLTDGIQK